MKETLITLILLALNAFAQQTTVAVLPSEGASDVFDNDDLEALTSKVRSVALKVLPRETFTLLTQDVVVKRLGGAENYIKECKESSCIVDLGKKAQVDYVVQASVGKLRNKMRLKVEVYAVGTSGLVGMYDGDGEYFDDYFALLDAVGKNVPSIFEKVPGVVPTPAVAQIASATVPAVQAPQDPVAAKIAAKAAKKAAVLASAAVPVVQTSQDPIAIKKAVAPTLQKTEAEKQSLSKKILVLEGINFLSGKADITKDSFANLMQIVETMRTYPKISFKVVGHTDDQGRRDAIQKLSESRAKAVVDFLVTHGISASRLDYEGKGPDQPIASNKTAAGRAKNRRIELQRTDNYE
ncbi:MAG: OmpA family protein [Fibromonadaceae bacterium]|nr:OmpA family protein [Fibromonadaceae bacterium]